MSDARAVLIDLTRARTILDRAIEHPRVPEATTTARRRGL